MVATRNEIRRALRTARVGMLAVGIVVVQGCGDDPAASDHDIRPGVLVYHTEGPQYTIDSDGASLQIDITTFGNGCYSRDREDVSVSLRRRLIIVSPFDRVALEGPCTDELLSISHQVQVTPPASGGWIIRIVGAERHSDGSETPVTFAIDAAVE